MDISDSDELIWVFLWLRYSYVRLLDWQRNFNTKPRELSYSMSRLTGEITNKIISVVCKNQNVDEENFFRSEVLLKMCLSMLGKGTGDGQKIRDEILQIMHKQKIKETNDHFYEQWHQKLHNNTTPDDVVICEALLAYLKAGGNMDVYWKTLNQAGVTKERLANFERRIVNEPYYMPQLISDLENFLHTLKSVHSSNDLKLMFDSARYALQTSNEFNKLQEIINYKNDWDTLKQINRVTDGREIINRIISANLKDSNKTRDLIFLDICLESYLRQLIEKIIHINLNFEQYVNEISAILRNLMISYKIDEIRLCYEDWVNIAEKLKNNLINPSNKTRESALKIKSVVDRLSRVLTHVIDYFNVNFDSKTKYLGSEFNTDPCMVHIFTEEIIRGTMFFALSMILKKIDPMLRKCANLGAWLIISRGNSKDFYKGVIKYSKTLSEVQMKTFENPTVLLTEQVRGNEEIPANVTCLIIIKSRDYPDILAHVSVRARNLGVPFLVCFDDQISQGLITSLMDKKVSIKFRNQNVEIVEHVHLSSNESLNTLGLSLENQNKINNNFRMVNLTEGFPSIFLELDDFSKDYLGAKSNNTKNIFKKLPDWVKYPESFAIPFNVCEYFLDFEENSGIKEQLEVLSKRLHNSKSEQISEILNRSKNLILGMNYVENKETSKLKKKLISFGIDKKVKLNFYRIIIGLQ